MRFRYNTHQIPLVALSLYHLSILAVIIAIELVIFLYHKDLLNLNFLNIKS
jgi:hypothetical protein